MVQLNDHGNAYQLAAKSLGCCDLAKQFEALNRRHLELGHLPHHLYEERHRLYSSLMSHAKSVLPSTQYEQLYSSF